jgi:hypothetical protein
MPISAWLAHITDPTLVPAEVMLALNALDVDIQKLYESNNIAFNYDTFFTASASNVGEALRQLADAMTAIQRQIITIPNVGTALVDATLIGEFICHKDGVLGLGVIYMATAPTAAAATLQIMKNGGTVYTFTFDIGEHGPKELDLSFISVVKNDIIGLYCTTASGAGGVAATMEF